MGFNFVSGSTNGNRHAGALHAVQRHGSGIGSSGGIREGDCLISHGAFITGNLSLRCRDVGCTVLHPHFLHVGIGAQINSRGSADGNNLFDVADGSLGEILRVLVSVARQRIKTIAAVQRVADIQRGGKRTVHILLVSDKLVILRGAGESVAVNGQLVGVARHVGGHLLVVRHGEGGTLGNFIFARTGILEVVFQNGHAVPLNGFGDLFSRPAVTHGDSLGSEIGVRVKGIGGVHAFVGTELLVVRPSVHASLIDDGLDVGDLKLGHSGGFHAVELRGFGGVIFTGVEIGVGGHVFSGTELREVVIRTLFVHKTVLSKGIDEFAHVPVARRIGFLHLNQFGAHIEFVVKPSGISHCFYPPEDNKKL